MKQERRPIRYDVSNMRVEYTVEIRNRFNILLQYIEDKEPEEIAEITKNVFTETAKKIWNQ